MALMLIGFLILIAVHLLPAFPRRRQVLIDALGQGRYKIGYGLVALFGLGLVIWGKGSVAFTELYTPPIWAPHLAWTLMPVAFYLLVAAYYPGNIRRKLAHPMLWAVSLWALLHLVANGDLASVVFFGGFLLMAQILRLSANRRGAIAALQSWSRKRDLMIGVVALAAFAVVFLLHQTLFGVTPGI